MAKPSQANEQTMEEILASIRRMMADDRPSTEPLRPVPAVMPAPPPAIGTNVSRLFAEPADDDDFAAEMAGQADAPEEMTTTATVIELAIAQAVSEAEDEVHRGAAVAATPPAVPAEAEEPAVPAVAEERRPAAAVQPQAPRPVPAETPRPRVALRDEHRAAALLSQQSGAAVAGAFDDLARAMFAGSNRTVDGLVEDLLRPMLRDWLEDNLPPLVERLVREEIERVSRGRR